MTDNLTKKTKSAKNQSTKDSIPFKDAFDVLQKNAERLEHDNNIDIDCLTDIIDESVKAYQICKARIDAVERALNDSFDNHNLNNHSHNHSFDVSDD